MCRLFGFRSIIPSQVHRSLMEADNALSAQSEAHPDGWGVAHYIDGTPHVIRSPSTALDDALFHRLSGVVASDTVIAHIRRATQGAKTVLNCHPFQHGRWTFAHNGDIPNLDARRAALRAEIAPRLRRYILGDTDSELVFFIVLTRLQRHGPLARRHGVEEVMRALGESITRVREICDQPPETRALLTVMLSDGATFVASRGGKELFVSTHKQRCADRDICPHLSPECEAPSKSGYVNHLVFSSERIAGDNVWRALADGDLLGVDWRMRLTSARIEGAEVVFTPLPSEG